MGNDDREPPFFFTKPADAVVENGVAVPYPPRTKNFRRRLLRHRLHDATFCARDLSPGVICFADACYS